VRKHELTEEQVVRARMLWSLAYTITAITCALGTDRRETRFAVNPQAIERERLLNAAWVALHEDEIRAHKLEYNKENKDKFAACNAAWRKAHRAQVASYQSVRRARVLGSTVGDRAAIAEIYRIAKEDPQVRCYLCKKRIPLGDRHVDHIVPVSRGGATSCANLAVAHALCNARKGASLLSEISPVQRALWGFNLA